MAELKKSVKVKAAYTDDMVEVFNLYVDNMSPSTTETHLHSYFERFGFVVKVRRLQKNQKPYALVHYKKSKSALKALTVAETFEISQIRVAAAYSWCQPFAAQQQASINELKKCAVLAKFPDWADTTKALPVEVFNGLSLSDQLHLARISLRHYEVFVGIARVQCQAMEFATLDRLPLWQLRWFMKMVGDSVLTLTGSQPKRAQTCKYISDSCKYLERLVISRADDWDMLLPMMMASVKRVELRYATLRTLDGLLHMELEELVIKDCYGLTGLTVKQLPQVRQLKLHTATVEQLESFVGLPADCGVNLIYLNISEFAQPQRLNVEAIADGCRQLETLHLDWDGHNYKDLVRLPKLRTVHLHSEKGKPSSDSFLGAFATLRDPKLERLQLHGCNLLNERRVELIGRIASLRHFACPFNDKLTDRVATLFGRLPLLQELVLSHGQPMSGDGLLQVVAQCQHLRELHIQCCKQVRRSFLRQCAKVLRESRTTSGSPLTVYCYETATGEEAQFDMPYHALLKVDVTTRDSV